MRRRCWAGDWLRITPDEAESWEMGHNAAEMLAPLALVTGTSRGLGLSVARELLARGWRVVGVARSPSVPELEGTGYLHIAQDLAQLEGLARVLEDRLTGELAPAGGPRLGLVNNAATLAVEATHELSAEQLVRSLIVGAAAPAWLMGWALRASPHTPLRIVNVSSGAATSPYPGWSAYCQTKAALDMAGAVLGEELSEVRELGGRDVALVSYSPGVVDTAMQAQLRAADERSFPRKQRFLELFASGRLLPPEQPAREIADLLAADDLPPFSRRRFGG